MKTIIKILLIISIWLVFGGMLALAIIYDGIYIQLVFDLGIILVSSTLGYIFKGVLTKEDSKAK